MLGQSYAFPKLYSAQLQEFHLDNTPKGSLYQYCILPLKAQGEKRISKLINYSRVVIHFQNHT